jgi:hypothetical protein
VKEQWVNIMRDYILGGLEQKLKFKEQMTTSKTPFEGNKASHIHTIP